MIAADRMHVMIAHFTKEGPPCSRFQFPTCTWLVSSFQLSQQEPFLQGKSLEDILVNRRFSVLLAVNKETCLYDDITLPLYMCVYMD